ncbi:hypothetical protein [Candidatus Bealeia paramacronuclearis]
MRFIFPFLLIQFLVLTNLSAVKTGNPEAPQKSILKKSPKSEKSEEEKEPKNIKISEGNHPEQPEYKETPHHRYEFEWTAIEKMQELAKEQNTSLVVSYFYDENKKCLMTHRYLSEEELKKYQQKKEQIVAANVVLDEEWEFGFLSISKAFGLHNEVIERHPQWNFERLENFLFYRTCYEVDWIKEALFYAFSSPNDKTLMENDEAYKNRRFDMFFERTNQILYLTTTQIAIKTQARENTKKLFNYQIDTNSEQFLTVQNEQSTLIENDFILKIKNELKASVKSGKTAMKKLLSQGLFQSINVEKMINSLDAVFFKNAAPELFFQNPEEKKKGDLRRFLIALKQYLMRDLNDEEKEFLTEYNLKNELLMSEKLSDEESFGEFSDEE